MFVAAGAQAVVEAGPGGLGLQLMGGRAKAAELGQQLCFAGLQLLKAVKFLLLQGFKFNVLDPV